MVEYPGSIAPAGGIVHEPGRGGLLTWGREQVQESDVAPVRGAGGVRIIKFTRKYDAPVD